VSYIERTGIVKVCIDLTEEEYEEIQQKIKGTRLTLFGFLWLAIQEKLTEKGAKNND